MRIDKNIQISEYGLGRGRPAKYPFAEMEIGDSVLVEGGRDGGTFGSSAYVAAQQYGRRVGRKFAGRKEPGETGKVRIWRVA